MHKQKIDPSSWERQVHFQFFNTFDEPFYGVTVEVDCTNCYRRAKERGASFYLSYLHKSIKAVNLTKNLRYRIEGEDVFLYDQIDASTTVDRADGTFGFSYMPYDPEHSIFAKTAKAEIERVRNMDDLDPGAEIHNVVHYSSIPWLKFTSLSHARHFPFRESIPKITFGKMTEVNNRKVMPYAIHVHHALVDGLHLGEHVDIFQGLLDGEE